MKSFIFFYIVYMDFKQVNGTSNPWIVHVKKYRKTHPKMPYKNILVKASASYKPIHKPVNKYNKYKEQKGSSNNFGLYELYDADY